MFKKVVEYFTNLCYILSSKVGFIKKKEVIVMEKQGILDARSLAYYIKNKYEKEYSNGKEISPLKLQKSLYFCFAYWGGFVRNSKTLKNELSDNNYNEILFSNKIEAWVYGPVVPEVYYESNNLEKYKPTCENPFTDDFVKNYIDGILEDVLQANDFKLVEVSHQDKCWKKNFKPNSVFHNLEIPFEEIITEYARKY